MFEMKGKMQFKKKLKNNKNFLIIAVLLLFPLVVGVIYALPLPQIIAVDVGDLLTYYGVAFGLLGSFLSYRLEKQKEEKEKNSKNRPVFIVKLEKTDVFFTLTIAKISNNTLSYLYLYDEFIADEVENQHKLQITFNLSVEEAKSKNINHNFTMDSEILDKDGYPRYIQLTCDDEDGNNWNCYYEKVNDCGKVYYYPKEISIL